MNNYFRIVYYLNRLLRQSRCSTGSLKEYQEKRIHEIVNYAYHHVPFYHEMLKRMELDPEKVTSIQNLEKLPIIRKQDILQNVGKLISNEFHISALQVESTSGSTGKPLSVYLSKKEGEFRKAKLLRANICCGQRPRDRWIVVAPPQYKNRSSNIQKLLGLYAPISVSVFDEPRVQVSAIQNHKPNVLEGYSSSLLLMARELDKSGGRIPGLRMIIGGAELVDDSDRHLLERDFGVPFYDQYSSVEFDALAWQCEEKKGYHIDADTVIVQLVDKNGETVAPGETGEIVCTSLFNHAMPFIRYAIGDVGVLSQNELCECGRTFPLMKVLSGRNDSIIVLPDGRMISPLVIGDGMMYFRYFFLIDQYRVIQHKKDKFSLLLKRKPGKVSDDDFRFELAAYFRKLIRVEDSGISIDIELVEEIPIDRGGKLRKVVSNVAF